MERHGRPGWWNKTLQSRLHLTPHTCSPLRPHSPRALSQVSFRNCHTLSDPAVTPRLFSSNVSLVEGSRQRCTKAEMQNVFVRDRQWHPWPIWLLGGLILWQTGIDYPKCLVPWGVLTSFPRLECNTFKSRTAWSPPIIITIIHTNLLFFSRNVVSFCFSHCDDISVSKISITLTFLPLNPM